MKDDAALMRFGEDRNRNDCNEFIFFPYWRKCSRAAEFVGMKRMCRPLDGVIKRLNKESKVPFKPFVSKLDEKELQLDEDFGRHGEEWAKMKIAIDKHKCKRERKKMLKDW